MLIVFQFGSPVISKICTCYKFYTEGGVAKFSKKSHYLILKTLKTRTRSSLQTGVMFFLLHASDASVPC